MHFVLGAQRTLENYSLMRKLKYSKNTSAMTKAVHDLVFLPNHYVEAIGLPNCYNRLYLVKFERVQLIISMHTACRTKFKFSLL